MSAPLLEQFETTAKIAARGIDAAILLKRMLALGLPEPLAAEARAIVADFHEFSAEHLAKQKC